jgi:hypothetical protein
LADEDEQLWAKLRAAYWDGLDAVLADGSPDVRTRVMTAGAFLAEAYGKPAQAIVGDPEQPVTFVLASLLQRAREEGHERGSPDQHRGGRHPRGGRTRARRVGQADALGRRMSHSSRGRGRQSFIEEKGGV